MADRVWIPNNKQTSSNVDHLKSARAEMLRARNPFAQYIVTLRAGRRTHIQGVINYARILDVEANKLVHGCRWQKPQYAHKRISVFGVVEGHHHAASIHMHLVLYSRTELVDDDIEELAYIMEKKCCVREFWKARVRPDDIQAYNHYILKGYLSPEGRDLSDRMYESHSFAYLRA